MKILERNTESVIGFIEFEKFWYISYSQSLYGRKLVSKIRERNLGSMTDIFDFVCVCVCV